MTVQELHPDTDQWLTAVRFAGPDRASFLQGQLTQDVNRLGAECPALPAASCDAKGRVIATLTLVWHPDHLVAIVHRDTANDWLDTISRFRLRARVDMGTDPDYAITARVSASTGQGDGLWALEDDGWRLGVLHESLVTRRKLASLPALDTLRWQQLRMTAGFIDLSPAAVGQFTPHMLNLDRVGAVSFDKGCYTGQEVVARTEHRGAAKRRARLFRLIGAHREPVRVGTRVLADENPGGSVVATAGHMMAVVCPIDAAPDTWTLEDNRPLSALE